MGRELKSFVELQKTLTQLGVTSGSALLRMSFRATDQPLEDAMVDISRYFEVESNDTSRNAILLAAQQQPDVADPPAASAPAPAPAQEQAQAQAQATAQDIKTSADLTLPPQAGQRSLKVFLAPSSSTPAAAAQPYNENDYVPTIEHAKLHQARLNNAGRNQRLLSDAELARQEEERQAKLNAVANVKVRIRFPDQTTVETTFGKDDCGYDVYEFVRSLLASSDEFSLVYVGSKAAHVSLKDGPQRLIASDGWKGNMLVSFIWAESVSDRVKKQPPLKEDIGRQAIPLAVAPIEDKSEEKPLKGKDGDRQKSVEAKLKGFLGFGKKK